MGRTHNDDLIIQNAVGDSARVINNGRYHFVWVQSNIYCGVNAIVLWPCWYVDDG